MTLAGQHPVDPGTGRRRVTIIGELGDDRSSDITIQDFVIEGETVIPVFSSASAFSTQTEGSPYAGKGIEIDLALLQNILRGDEILMLDPGSPARRRLTVPELAMLQEG